MERINRDSIFEEFPVIETEKYFLKQLTDEYKEDLIHLMSEGGSIYHSGMGQKAVADQIDSYLKKSKDMYDNIKGLRWAIVSKESSEFMGDIALYNLDVYSNNAELGYTINKESWKKGVALECSRAVIDFAFNDLLMHKIVIIIDERNTPSLKLMEKLGFKQDGCLRDEHYSHKEDKYISFYVYSLLKSDERLW